MLHVPCRHSTRQKKKHHHVFDCAAREPCNFEKKELPTALLLQSVPCKEENEKRREAAENQQVLLPRRHVVSPEAVLKVVLEPCDGLGLSDEGVLGRLADRAQPRRREVVECRTRQRPLSPLVRLVDERALEALEVTYQV